MAFCRHVRISRSLRITPPPSSWSSSLSPMYRHHHHHNRALFWNDISISRYPSLTTSLHIQPLLRRSIKTTIPTRTPTRLLSTSIQSEPIRNNILVDETNLPPSSRIPPPLPSPPPPQLTSSSPPTTTTTSSSSLHPSLSWTRHFGTRDPTLTTHLHSLANLPPSHPDYHDVSQIPTPDFVTIVRTKEQAHRVLRLLSRAPSSTIHACDTEVMSIDLSSVGPVGNGYVTCVSVYSGPEFDYGEGKGKVLWIDNLDDAFGVLMEFKDWFEDEGVKKVWHNYGFDRHVMWNEGIDCRGFEGDTMHMARLEDTSRSKTSSGSGYSLEALTHELLDRRKKPMKEIFGVPRLRKDGTPGQIKDVPPLEILQRDPRFRKSFVEYSAYDAQGTWYLFMELKRRLESWEWVDDRHLYDYYNLYMRPFGNVLTDMERRGIRVNATDYLASVERIARDDRERHVTTFLEWAATKIGADGWALNTKSASQLATFLFGGSVNEKTGEETERVRVFRVPREEVSERALRAYEERERKEESEEGEMKGGGIMLEDMTVAQLKALCKENNLKKSGNKSVLQERLRDYYLSDGNDNDKTTSHESKDITLDDMTLAQLKALCKENNLKLYGNKSTLRDRLLEHDPSLAIQNKPTSKEEEEEDEYSPMSLTDLRHVCATRQLNDHGTRLDLLQRIRKDVAFTREIMTDQMPQNHDGFQKVSKTLQAAAHGGSDAMAQILEELNEKKKAQKKFVDVTIRSIGMTPEKFTEGGAPSVTANVLSSLAGDPFAEPAPRYGSAYDFFGGGAEGHAACVALYSLTAIGSIDTMIANFLTTLQELTDNMSRVHCSLNLNTETGRLSSRRPNLQNQPALEKDKYKIRRAFEASPGNNLIVADYGQLELRLLASMTSCESMITAFRAGGDFHSRTAMGMFPYIKQRVDDGEILFEWDDHANPGQPPPKPLLKDEYAAERRKAKTLNFSIAYGKTAHGLTKDWGVSLPDAEATLKAWYDSRPEVLRWQKDTKAEAKRTGLTRTLMGRYRRLPDAKSKQRHLVGRAERAAINTPIQGGAADVAMMAMIKINNHERLKELGWVLLMQIHDEVILEGPEETAEEAFGVVKECMEKPWVFGLEETSVPLEVDGSFIHKNWYDAK